MSLSSSLIFIFFLLLLPPLCRGSYTPTRKPRYQLTTDFYKNTCPHVDQLVASVTSQQFQDAPIAAPATIRLFFHDCFVQGCDASVLISSKAGEPAAEKEAEDNREIAVEAYDTVSKAKQLVESKCPGVVSCADILAMAARDFVHLAGGPYYQVKKGRWDGKISLASKVQYNLPRANASMNDLLKLFNSKGLSLEDLVTLSGAHSIGFAHCKHFVKRIYGTDSSMDPRLLKSLKLSCPPYGGNTDVVAPLDVMTPFVFDNGYYSNLEAKMGVLGSDQTLFSDARTRQVAQAHARDRNKFFEAFSESMERMGSIGIKRGWKHGEKRKVCSMHA